MIEVFSTNVTDPEHAGMLLDRIHRAFSRYTANFDLDDCDRILRVCCNSGPVNHEELIDMLKMQGFHAQVLPG